MNGMVPHIVQYQGSKRMLAPQILRYMPPKFERLVEPFAGMAAITVAAGKSIGAYRFGDPTKAEDKLSKTAGRTVLSAALKKALVEKYGSKCFIYLQPMEERLLQIDHRVPYEIGGEQDEKETDCYMLLSPSANRAKSWTCEHCPNWERKNVDFCVRCFWAHPENYTHIAGQEQRQIIITFTGDEIEDYNRLIALVGKDKAEKTIKEMIEKYVK